VTSANLTAEASIRTRLAALDVCTMSDALDRLGLAGYAGAFLSSLPGRRISGRVHTVKLAPGAAPAGVPLRHLGTRAIEASSPGDVIVVEQAKGIEAGCWGGILTRGALARGVSGIVADGLVRDVDEASALGLPIFSRGYTARTARGRVHEVSTDTPITVGSVDVSAGDYVVADSSGVAFVTAGNINTVLEAAEEIAARETAMAARIAEGHPMTSVMDGRYELMLQDPQTRSES
jgi:4-hydroxy-4-methyl-2-oxoglutarate aldolase